MKWDEVKGTQESLSPEELEAKNSNAYYQATQDWQRGGANPDDAFKARGFKKNKNGRWVFDK